VRYGTQPKPIFLRVYWKSKKRRLQDKFASELALPARLVTYDEEEPKKRK